MALSGSSQYSAGHDLEGMVQMWYDEVWASRNGFLFSVLLLLLLHLLPQIKDMRTENVDPFSVSGNTGVTGHLTQLLWADTQKCGCGFIVYKNGGFFMQVCIVFVFFSCRLTVALKMNTQDH